MVSRAASASAWQASSVSSCLISASAWKASVSALLCRFTGAIRLSDLQAASEALTALPSRSAHSLSVPQ